MRRLASLAAASALVLAPLAGCGAGGGDAGTAEAGASGLGRFDGARAFRDLRAQVRLGPRPSGSAASRREVRLIVARVRAAGIERITVQRPLRNVVARIPGSEPRTIVLGAHHDTKDAIPGFVGANDGASGVAVLLELARTLPARLDGPGVRLVFFDGEEARGSRDFERDGTRGSRQYVRYATGGGRQGAGSLEGVEAMVLFDMVGDCELQIPRESLSDPGLYERFAAAAAAGTEAGAANPFNGKLAGGILDDHLPFRAAGVPALDVIDFSYGTGPPPGAWWHTAKDTLDRVCPESLGAVGEAALGALASLRR